jgi:type IV pilus assembly protein PilM
MQSELNLDDSYSVSYIIVGEIGGDGGEPAYKILATACPYEIVNSYREVFKLLSISLKSVMIGCNCITKVLLADTKIKSKMPLLAVQIDNNFISLNLYEQGQLSFSRFASIDAADYGYSDDYVFEAVNENIFRMLQFHRSRNTGEAIENVIFYGDTHEYVRLTDELEKLDLKTSLINVPPQIHGHENLEFSLYANAIGAMFKRTKETERINLLDTDFSTVVKNRVRDDSAGNVFLIAAVAGALVIGGGAWIVQSARNKSVENDITATETYINSEDTQRQLRHHEHLLMLRDQVTENRDKMSNLKDAYLSQPAINGEKYDVLEETLKESYADALKNLVGEQAESEEESQMQGELAEAVVELFGDSLFKVVNPQYTDGKLTFTANAVALEEKSQKLPAAYVEELLKKPEFMAVGYSGYKVNEEKVKVGGEGGEEVKVYVLSFGVTAQLNSEESAYHPDKADDSSDESTEEEAE